MKDKRSLSTQTCIIWQVSPKQRWVLNAPKSDGRQLGLLIYKTLKLRINIKWPHDEWSRFLTSQDVKNLNRAQALKSKSFPIVKVHFSETSLLRQVGPWGLDWLKLGLGQAFDPKQTLVLHSKWSKKQNGFLWIQGNFPLRSLNP